MKKIFNKYLIIFIVLYLYYLYTNLFSIFYKKNYIVFFKADDGESILIASQNKYLLIDGGASSYSLNTLYKYTNYTYPKNILITHFHFDHISGFIKTLKAQPYYDIYMSESSYKNKEYLKYFNNLKVQNIKTVYKDDLINIGDLKIKILWPNLNCKNVDLNYCSVSLHVTDLTNKSVMLLSDNPSGVQINYRQYFDGNLELIKVPHHGSANSFNKNLFTDTNLRYSIFTVGPNNKNILNSKVSYFYNKTARFGTYYTFNGDVVYFFD